MDTALTQQMLFEPEAYRLCNKSYISCKQQNIATHHNEINYNDRGIYWKRRFVEVGQDQLPHYQMMLQSSKYVKITLQTIIHTNRKGSAIYTMTYKNGTLHIGDNFFKCCQMFTSLTSVKRGVNFHVIFPTSP